MKVQIVRNTLNPLPRYETPESAGCDLRADVNSVNTKLLFGSYTVKDDYTTRVVIRPGGRALIPTGLKIALPEGYEARIQPRSGLALKHGITVLNTPGCIDSDYRGDIGVILMNTSNEPFEVLQGDRIAQMLISKVERAQFIPVDELNETDRGAGGFGSTGSK